MDRRSIGLIGAVVAIVAVFGSAFGAGLAAGVSSATVWISPFETLNCVHAPEISSSFWARSVGWAPFSSQSSARSLSISTSEGS